MKSLVELCCNRIVINLWKAREPLTRDHHIDVYFWKTEQNIHAMCEAVDMGLNLRPRLKAKIKEYGDKILLWSRFLIYRLNLHTDLAARLYWTANGEDIDMLRIVFDVIFPNVNAQTRFSVASELCLGDVARDVILNQYTIRDRNTMRKRLTDCMVAKENESAALMKVLFQLFWHDRIMSDDSFHHEVARHFNFFGLDDRKANVKATLFALAVVTGNVLGMRYLWNEFDPFQRWLIIRGLPEAVTAVHILLELEFLGNSRVEMSRVNAGEHILYDYKIKPGGIHGSHEFLTEGQVTTESRRPFEEKALLLLENLGFIEITVLPRGYDNPIF